METRRTAACNETAYEQCNSCEMNKGPLSPQEEQSCCTSNKDATADVTIITAELVIVIRHYHLMQWGKKGATTFRLVWTIFL